MQNIFAAAGDLFRQAPSAARQAVYELFGRMYKKRDENFGNGRDGRNVFEQAIAHQANRLVGLPKIDERAFSEILPEDIPQLEQFKGIRWQEIVSGLPAFVSIGSLRVARLGTIANGQRRKKRRRNIIHPPWKDASWRGRCAQLAARARASAARELQRRQAMRELKVVTIALVTLSAFWYGAPPASADWLTDFLKRVIVQPGGYGGSFAPNQASIQANINNGIANYHNQIATGVASGRLTAEEASRLNSEANRLQAMHNTFMSDGGYTDAEVQQMLSAFTSMNNLIATSLNNSVVVGSTYGGYAGLNDWAAVHDLRASIRARINDGLADGSLTPAEARMLRLELQQINQRLNWRAMRGNPNLNPIVRRLIALDRHLTNLMEDRWVAGRDTWRWY